MFTAVAQKNLGDAESYFDEHLSQNDYYASGEIRPGQWIGAGAERLGLKGRSVKMAKMAAQIFGIATVGSQENSCSTLLTSVSYAKWPTAFVGGVSYGKSQFSFPNGPHEASLTGFVLPN